MSTICPGFDLSHPTGCTPGHLPKGAERGGKGERAEKPQMDHHLCFAQHFAARMSFSVGADGAVWRRPAKAAYPRGHGLERTKASAVDAAGTAEKRAGRIAADARPGRHAGLVPGGASRRSARDGQAGNLREVRLGGGGAPVRSSSAILQAELAGEGQRRRAHLDDGGPSWAGLAGACA